MKKFAAFLMTLLILGVAGCGDDKDKPAAPKEKPAAAASKTTKAAPVETRTSIGNLSGVEEIKQLYLDYYDYGGRQRNAFNKARRDANTVYEDVATHENWLACFKAQSAIVTKELENLKAEKVTPENEKFRALLQDYMVKNRTMLDLAAKHREAEINKTAHPGLKTKVYDAETKQKRALMALNKAYYEALNGKAPETIWTVDDTDPENKESTYTIVDNFEGVKLACTIVSDINDDIAGVKAKGQYTYVRITLKNDTKNIISIDEDALSFVDNQNRTYKAKWMVFNENNEKSLKLRPRVSNSVEYIFDIPRDVLMEEGHLEIKAPYVKNGPVKLSYPRRVR